MAKNKFYVVWDGYQTGIFDSWQQCKLAVNNYPQAKYKSFESAEMAKKAFSGSFFDFVGKKTIFEPKLSKDELEKIGNPILNSIAVDAACAGNPGLMEYRGVFTDSKSEIFKKGPYQQGTNNVGEFLALVHGIAYLKQHNSDIPIYSDSRTAIGWIKAKQTRTRLEKTPKNEKLFELISRAENWLQTNTFPNKILKWETKAWGEIPADFGRKQ
jgi:ribonuclease HI